MLVAAAVVPATPSLLPEVSPGQEPDLDEVRAATRRAVDWLLAGPAQVVWVVAVTRDQPRRPAVGGLLPAGAHGHLGGYGLPEVGARLGAGSWGDGVLDLPALPAGSPLPEELVVAARLLGARSGDQALRGVAVPVTTPPVEAAETGRALAGAAARVALLVLADGSARGEAASPGHLHPGAHALDDEVALALGAGDGPALAGLDAARCEDLWCAGRAGWQVLAGARAASGTEQDGARWKARLDLAARPRGVGLFVARWMQGRPA